MKPHSQRHQYVLALNSGSSSLKFGLYHVGASSVERLLAGEFDDIDEEQVNFQAIDARGDSVIRETLGRLTREGAIARIAHLITESRAPAPHIIGHRIVHGGPKLRQHCVIDARVLELCSRPWRLPRCTCPRHCPSFAHRRRSSPS